MEIIFVDSFKYDGSTIYGQFMNMSKHCHITPSDEIKIYGSLDIYDLPEEIIFPKVIYVNDLSAIRSTNTSKILPDLVKVGSLLPIQGMTDFGGIKEVDNFIGMTRFFESFKIHDIMCENIDGNIFRFTTPKGTWDIKVNKYN
jgi:hypothetical protein